MRLLTVSLLAAAGIALAAPASAEDVYVGGHDGGVGVGVDVGSGPHHRDRDVTIVRRPHCHTTIIKRDDGVTKKIRKCD
jgi:hypothetical protein